MPDRIGRLARRARPPKRTESTDVFPVVPAQDSSAEQPSADTAEVDAPDTPDPETTGDQTPEPEACEPEAPEPEAPQSPESDSAEQPTAVPSRYIEMRGRAARFGVGFLRLVLLAAVLALAWLVDQARVQVPRARIWLRPRAIRLTVTVVAGVRLWTSYPLLNWWWAAIVAFGALAWVLTRPATTPGGGFGYGFLFGVAFYLPLIRWIDLMVGPALLLVLVVMCALFTGLFGLGAVTVRRLPGWPVWFALLWTAQEWLKCTVPFGGFPWGVVAAGQTSGPFLPLVRLGGVPLLSLAIVLTGCGAAAFLIETVTWWAASRRRHDPAQCTSGDDEIADTPPAVIVPALCVCVTFFLAAAVWPQVRHSGNGSGNEPTVTAAVVQGNVPRLGLEFNAQRLAVLGNDVRETRRLADDIHAGRAPQPDFVIWPEDASEIDPTENPDAAQEISSAVDAIGVPILVGTVLDLPNRRDNEPAQTNTVIVWNPQSGPGDRHDKRIVQPFGEYLPWRGFFRHLSGMADMAGYIVPGTGSGVVHARGTAIGIATCWEVSFDRALRHSVRNGAQILAVPANNANFNQAMSEQQLAFSKLRAVELDRYTLVASNVGISAFVTPDGRELRRTGFFTPAYLDGQVRLKTTTTPAATWGPVVQGGLVIAALAVLVAAILHNGWLTELSRRLSGLAERTRRSPGDTDGSDETDDDAVDDSRLADDEEPGDTGRHTARPGPDEGEL